MYAAAPRAPSHGPFSPSVSGDSLLGGGAVDDSECSFGLLGAPVFKRVRATEAGAALFR